MSHIKRLGFRSIRKASHLSANVLGKPYHFLRKVERKATELIQSSGKDAVQLDALFYQGYPYLFPIHAALPNLNQRPSVTVFVPSLTPKGFYGGIATLLIVSAKLSIKLGYDYRVVQTSGYHDTLGVSTFLKQNGIHIPSSRISTFDASKRNMGHHANLPLHPEDIVVVSAWWDAYIASLLPLKKKFLYMIQDFEPIFYNNSDTYLLAEGTYHSERFIPLCNTKIMYDFMTKKGYSYIKSNGSWFEPAVGRTPQKSKTIPSSKKKLFIYGRPSVHRNLFFHALQAVDKAFSDEILDPSEWECYMAGESDAHNIKLACGIEVVNKGKLSIEEYISFASEIDIAVSLMMAPHPSYPPLELASLGAKVLTTQYENKQDLSMYSNNILCVEPTINSLVSGLGQLATDKSSKKAGASKIPTDWNKTLELPLDEVITKLHS